MVWNLWPVSFLSPRQLWKKNIQMKFKIFFADHCSWRVEVVLKKCQWKRTIVLCRAIISLLRTGFFKSYIFLFTFYLHCTFMHAVKLYLDDACSLFVPGRCMLFQRETWIMHIYRCISILSWRNRTWVHVNIHVLNKQSWPIGTNVNFIL